MEDKAPLEEFLALPPEEQLKKMNTIYPVFANALCEGSPRVGENYFRLKMDAGGKVVAKDAENVYCNELYRHIGNITEDKFFFPFELMTQVDKGAHIFFPKGHRLYGKTPDILFHTSGHMEGNFVVIEVKPLVNVCHPNNKSHDEKVLRDDLEKLTAFRKNDIHYFRAIHLLYGNTYKDLQNYGLMCKRLHDAAMAKAHNKIEQSEINLKNISVFWHERPGSPIKRFPWFEIIPDLNRW